METNTILTTNTIEKIFIKNKDIYSIEQVFCWNFYKECVQEVYNLIGPGHQEIIYSKALQREFILRNVDFQEETHVNITYKGAVIGSVRTDISIINGPVIELKAISNKPTNIQFQQIVNYLKLTGKQEGYLVNFPQPSSAISKLTRPNVDFFLIKRN